MGTRQNAQITHQFGACDPIAKRCPDGNKIGDMAGRSNGRCQLWQLR